MAMLERQMTSAGVDVKKLEHLWVVGGSVK
jgi:hypothetical protein